MIKKSVLYVQIAFSLNQSYGETFSYNDLKNDPSKDHIVYVLKSVLGGTGLNVNIPPLNLNEPYNGSIILDNLAKSPITYKYLPYNSLSDFEKKIFDYFKFNQNNFITIVGLYDLFSNKLITIPNLITGAFRIDSKTQCLHWINICQKTNTRSEYDRGRKMMVNKDISIEYQYQLESCPFAKARIIKSINSEIEPTIFFSWEEK